MYIISSIVVILSLAELIYSQYVETPGRDYELTNKPEFFGKACKLLTSRTGPNNTLQPNGLKLDCASRFLIWPEEVPENEKLFKFTKIGMGVSENLVDEEFHIYQASLHSEKLKLTVFNVTNDDVNNKHEISSITVNANTNGWRIFNVAPMLSTEPTDEDKDYTFTVIATSVATNDVVMVDFVRVTRTNEPPKMPIYVHFLNEVGGSNGNICRFSRDVYNMQDGDEQACNILR